MPPPPLSSPLFLYTTLFRSRHAARITNESAGHFQQRGRNAHRPVCVFAQRRAQKLLRPEGELGIGDRKSTRLNSSHVAISYAVFCLKKTKQNSEERQWRRRD